MNAPDKIYLVRDAVNPEGIFDSVASKNPMFYDDIAYIRKDALLEWARTEQKKFREDTQFDMGYLRAVNDLIKKLESL